MRIVDIPVTMQKFYGQGSMLHPDQNMIAELLQKIPYGKVAIIDSLCEKMAYDHGTDVTCPMRTSAAIKKISKLMALNEQKNSIPFWRVIRKNHLLINSPFTDLCATNLRKEGFRIDRTSKGEFKVQKLEERLFTFI
ncbi:MGMT family protein [Fulvivirgaceae bacterium BMA10]|uniref:MGMT family protein n=1 Tax=Splendidivirga corallicola TaxID=3051826 RepID=A0ABT8KUR5_9BACT|nr:MGMT family protein [Fulvivirgaceae bacterium BMA10]